MRTAFQHLENTICKTVNHTSFNSPPPPLSAPVRRAVECLITCPPLSILRLRCAASIVCIPPWASKGILQSRELEGSMGSGPSYSQPSGRSILKHRRCLRWRPRPHVPPRDTRLAVCDQAHHRFDIGGCLPVCPKDEPPYPSICLQPSFF